MLIRLFVSSSSRFPLCCGLSEVSRVRISKERQRNHKSITDITWSLPLKNALWYHGKIATFFFPSFSLGSTLFVVLQGSSVVMDGDMSTSHSVELKQVFCKCMVTILFLSFFFPFSCATKGLYKNISLKSQNRQDYYPPVEKWAHVTPSKVVPRKDQRQNPRKRRKSSLVKPRIECSCSILSRGYCVLGYQGL